MKCAFRILFLFLDAQGKADVHWNSGLSCQIPWFWTSLVKLHSWLRRARKRGAPRSGSFPSNSLRRSVVVTWPGVTPRKATKDRIFSVMVWKSTPVANSNGADCVSKIKDSSSLADRKEEFEHSSGVLPGKPSNRFLACILLSKSWELRTAFELPGIGRLEKLATTASGESFEISAWFDKVQELTDGRMDFFLTPKRGFFLEESNDKKRIWIHKSA